MKIRELTNEEMARFPEFVKKWTEIQFCTDPAERPQAEEGIRQIYRAGGLDKPKIVWCSSPLANYITCAIILRIQSPQNKRAILASNSREWEIYLSERASRWAKSVRPGASPGAMLHAEDVLDSTMRSPTNRKWDVLWDTSGISIGGRSKEKIWASWASVKSSVEASARATIEAAAKNSVLEPLGESVGIRWSAIGDSVWNSVWESVGSSVGLVVGDPVERSIRSSVRSSILALIEPSVRDSVTSSTENMVRASVRDAITASLRDTITPINRDSFFDQGYGQDNADWLASFDYLAEVLQFKEQTQQLAGMWLQSKSGGWFLPRKNLCWMAERHNILHLKNNRPHCENGPAVVYPDGWSVWALNGICMKPQYVMTPADKLTPAIVLKEKNVDQRRELIRKIGVIRMIDQGKVIDTQGDYKLVDMSPLFPGIPYAPHLLMENPSVDDTWHLEGVDPQCHTVQDALNWRAGDIHLKWSPELLS
jgi:hypothetical protein